MTDFICETLTKSVVNDILLVLEEKSLVTEVFLPELFGSCQTYSIDLNVNEFSVMLTIQQDENINDFFIDASYYSKDDDIEVDIIIKNFTDINYELLYYELSEVIRHEIEHMKQYHEGRLYYPKYKKNFSYYTSDIELEAQIAGFKYRSYIENKDVDEVINEWFDKYPHRHGLDSNEVSLVKELLFESFQY